MVSVRKDINQLDGKKILITGFSGFVAKHFIEYLAKENLNIQVIGLDVRQPNYDFSIFEPNIKVSFFCVDMTEKERLQEIVQREIPDYVLHLAAYSSVAYSWEHPGDSFLNNGNIFLNLIECIKDINPKCKILSVGSSEEYGNVDPSDIPIRENHSLNPISPYAVARIAQEYLSKIFSESYGMQIVLTRSFNHIGPGQDERFVVPSFIKRIVDIKKAGECDGEIETGDLSIVRDFVDVRDVVKAYYQLLLHGRSGEIYNVCSGKGIVLGDLVQEIATVVGVSVTTVENPNLIRPKDNKVIIGSNRKISDELGWKPEINIHQTLCDMIQGKVHDEHNK